MENNKSGNIPKVLFLYSNERTTAYKDVIEGHNHGGGFWGLSHINEYGINASFLELEQFFSKSISRFLRDYVFRNVYFVHIIFFPKILKYDLVYTSAAFGTQLIHTLYPFKKPKWVMHDFNIINLIGNKKTFKEKLFFWMVNHCDGIITLGKSEADRLKEIFPRIADRIRWIPFGVDTEFFKPLALSKKNTVFSAGRDPDRDWDMLVRIAPRIDAEIIIATRPQRVSHLQPLPSNVKVGQFEPGEFKKIYDESKVFVIPLNTKKGVNEAMGCSVLFEAFGMGKAIVATKTETISSYIRDGENGHLVNEGDDKKFIESVNFLLENNEAREAMEKASLNYAKSELEIHKQTKELASFFIKIIEQN